MALTSYPAIFYKEKSGHYSVVFPDLNHLATCGDNLDDAIAMAVDCLAGYIHSEWEDGNTVPAPSNIKDVDPASEADPEDDYSADDIFINIVSVDINEYAKKYFNKAVKKTLTIPKWLNDAALARNINFSAVLQEALKTKIEASKEVVNI